ncbi:transmembrane protein 163-like isoform X2 [Cynoglossus semilaevis]|uniref:transmembrane protein 163-like isoform X2 n=1 Tax=Cynoglossus semilaevis TaxID=244447 RepID=UPI0007DC8C42|nr:transmembrane protein 163-like isoform X2 [Cynoglossus semilaevis]
MYLYLLQCDIPVEEMTDSTESRERDGVQQPVEALGHHTGHRTEQEQELQQQTEVQKVQQQQQQQQETLHQFSPNSKTRSAEIMDREMKITDSIDTRGLLESSVRLKPHEAQNYRKKALWVSWTSILVTIVLAIAAFTVSIMRNSASAFGFAFDATLDVLSSIIVLWRYSSAAAVHSAHREYIACVILGVVFILSSLCILGKSIHDLATRLLPEVDNFLFSVAIISGLVCIVLAVIKFMLGKVLTSRGKVLTSRALITDGFNSLVGGIMGFSILISAEVFKHEPNVWYLDGTIGVLIGLIILAYGVKLLLDMVPRIRQTRNYERFE